MAPSKRIVLIGCVAAFRLMLVFVLPLPLNRAVSPLTGTAPFQLPAVVHLLSGAASPVHDRVAWACEIEAAKSDMAAARSSRWEAIDNRVRSLQVAGVSTPRLLMLNGGDYFVNKI